MDRPGETGDGQDRRPGVYAWYVAIVLMLTYTLSLLDRKLPFILVEPIKHDLGLNDTQIGLLTGIVFAAVYSTIAIPIASFADRSSRKHIVGAAVIIWSALTALGGFAQSFWHLAASRVGVAAGEAACSPASHSMIADYFSPKYRGRAMGLYFVGAQLGMLLGLVLGGWINDLANWRVAMFLLGAPGLALGLLLFFTVREPKRPSRNTGESEVPPSMLEVARALFGQRAFVHMLLGAILFMFTGGATQAFTPSYLIRTFDLSTSETGLIYGLTVGVAGIAGALLGGQLGDWLRAAAPWKAMMLVAVAFFVSTPFLLFAYYTSSLVVCLVMIFIAQVAAMMYAGPSFSTLQSLVPPRMHAVASAIYLFALSGVGLSLGPLFVGAFSDWFTAEGWANPLGTALMLAVLPKFWSAFHYMMSARALRAHQREIVVDANARPTAVLTAK